MLWTTLQFFHVMRVYNGHYFTEVEIGAKQNATALSCEEVPLKSCERFEDAMGLLECEAPCAGYEDATPACRAEKICQELQTRLVSCQQERIEREQECNSAAAYMKETTEDHAWRRTIKEESRDHGSLSGATELVAQACSRDWVALIKVGLLIVFQFVCCGAGGWIVTRARRPHAKQQ